MTTRPKKRKKVTKGERRRIFAEEALLTNVQLVMQRSLVSLGWNRRMLADRLNVTESQVSQFFAPTANLTVKTVASIFDAMDDILLVSSVRVDQDRN